MKNALILALLAAGTGHSATVLAQPATTTAAHGLPAAEAPYWTLTTARGDRDSYVHFYDAQHRLLQITRYEHRKLRLTRSTAAMLNRQLAALLAQQPAAPAVPAMVSQAGH